VRDVRREIESPQPIIKKVGRKLCGWPGRAGKRGWGCRVGRISGLADFRPLASLQRRDLKVHLVGAESVWRGMRRADSAAGAGAIL
jgi:hypothetical protein